MRGSLRALWRPTYQTLEAVRGISFAMQEGELLGFIGPNGAGKSSTIKILTGILHPSGGEAAVLGYVPWQQRQALAYQIGTVFGQRPQLWYHLPAVDTFYLFGKIYELEDAALRRRIAFLAEAFEIEEMLETPVRKLSLGQRMRCEVAASLLHQPRLLVLGGLLIPLDFFPEWLQTIALNLPFAWIIFGPARLFVDPSLARLGAVLTQQGIWLAVVGGAVWLFYRWAVARLVINGG